MIKLRRGEYVIYKGKEYTKSTKESLKGNIRLISWDKDDLKNGFLCYETQFFMSKYGFSCEKEVPKSEITEAYEVETYAIYRDIKFQIHSSKENQIRIVKLCCGGIEDDEIEKKLQSWGFSVFQADKLSIAYDSYISLNDPELEIIEQKTELDINKL